MGDILINRLIDISPSNNTAEKNRIKIDVIKPLSKSELAMLLICLQELDKKFDLMISAKIHSLS